MIHAMIHAMCGLVTACKQRFQEQAGVQLHESDCCAGAAQGSRGSSSILRTRGCRRVVAVHLPRRGAGLQGAPGSTVVLMLQPDGTYKPAQVVMMPAAGQGQAAPIMYSTAPAAAQGTMQVRAGRGRAGAARRCNPRLALCGLALGDAWLWKCSRVTCVCCCCC